MNDTTCPNSSGVIHKQSRSRNFDHVRRESLKGLTQFKRADKDDKSMDLSFINDANMITEFFDSKPLNKETPTEWVGNSNLDITFDKSDDKEDTKNWVQQKPSNYSSSKNSDFKGGHWNFGSRRQKQHKSQKH